MIANHLPRIRHILPMTRVQRERKLDGHGVLTVRVREKVQSTDVIGEVQPQPQHHFLDLASALGVSDAEAARLLRVDPGSDVEAGQVLAGPVGIARRTVRAPANGKVLSLSRGRVLFEAREGARAVHAGVPGEVTASDGASSIIISAVGALVQGAWGNGRRGWGVLRDVGESRSARLEPSELDMILRGAVVLVGVVDNPKSLHQATEIPIRGLVCGSMASELIPTALHMPYPILLTEGFGAIPMNSPTYDLLSTNAGREANVEASLLEPYKPQQPEILVPLPATQDLKSPERIVQLVPGVRVRALRAPHVGAVGSLLHLMPGVESFPSGILARSAMIELEGIGSVAVPLSNLEVIA
ncbi:MAG: hypothetical protein ACC647_06300 [Anaerolineales bacterium]